MGIRRPLFQLCHWLVCLTLVGGLFPVMAAQAAPGPGTTHRQYVESEADFMNPERGFEFDFDPSLPQYEAAKSREAGYSIAFWNIDLEAFRSAPLDAAFLDGLEQGFVQVRQAGIKVQMNFAYGTTGQDAPKETVLGHIEQLKPLLTGNADVIVSAQAGFIGAFGAWTSSSNDLADPATARLIVQALLDALPDNRMIQIPWHVSKESLYPNNNTPLQPAEAFSGSDRARIGYFNNTFLNDSYAAGVKQYIADDTRFTPIGGQTGPNPPRSDAVNAIPEMAAMHYSYLYAGWHPAVYQAWKDQGKYEEIGKRLGYRFVLDEAGWTSGFRPGRTATIELDVRNVGFAAMFNPRPVYLVLDGAAGRFDIPLEGIDPRRWSPGETTPITAEFQVPAAVPPGEYKLALWMPDEDARIQARPEYAVRLANENVWDAIKGYNVLADQVTVLAPEQNSAPVVTDAAYAVWENTAVNGTLPAADADGDPLTFSIVQNGQKGTATLTDAVNGMFAYTPNAGTTGTDTFTFQVHDGAAASNIGAVTVTIRSIMDIPAPGYGEYTESFEDFLNPERGFTYYFQPGDPLYEADQARALGYSIDHWNVQLDAFRSGPISQSFLDQLNSAFDKVRQAGIKVVLRFNYDFSAIGNDAPKNVVLGHLEQLKPVLTDNADVLAVMQAGFVGAWGEWHTSQNNLDQPANAVPIMEAILDALPANRMVQSRTPAKKEELFPNGGVPLQPAEAFSGSVRARIGHHNDCFVASYNDVGTYPIDAVEQWKDYVWGDTRYTPHGGETCAPSSYAHSSKAIPEMEKLHTSYLFSGWHPAVYQGWKDQGKFDEISRRLGYRLVLDNAGWTKRFRPGQTASVELNLRNVGFAAMFNERPVYIVLDGAGGRFNFPLPDADPRWWAPGEATNVTAQFQVPANVPPGDYKLALWLPDDAESIRNRPEYAVRLANEGVWDENKGYNVIAEHLAVLAPEQNTAPEAADQALQTAANTPVSGMLLASDGDSDSLTFSIVTNGQKGTAAITDAATGAFTYTPLAGQSGTDTFTFRANDGRSDSNVATVTVTIEPGAEPSNQAPVAQDGAVTTQANKAVSGAVGASDADGDTLAYSIVTNGLKGTSVILASGTFVYTPNPGATGTDTFTFRAYDGKEYSNIATVTVTIQSPSPIEGGGGQSGGDGSGTGTSGGGDGGNGVKSAAPGTLAIPAGGSGTVSLGEDISVSVPAGASDRELRIAIRKTEEEAVPANGQRKLLSAVFELENGLELNLQKPATVTVKFDASQLGRNQRVAVFRYDEAKKAWLELESVITGNQATVSLEQFGRLAVFAIDEAPSVPAMTLTDMKGHWAEQQIRQAVSDGIVDGYEDGTFKPDATVTRAEFTVLLARALQLPDGSSDLTFTDREQIGPWAADAIANAVEAGIISGYEDGSFRPDAVINRAEMAVMIARALGWKADAGVLTPFADDGTIPSWAKPFVMAAAQKGILEGREGNRFAPLDTATRAEAVVLLLRVLEAAK
ncbi:DUF4832 domain-containing protein [Paenibacillus contaminans]|uniref:SLH domain-containing protein n=1 Tax=Paenibacillus contaminans TaxID=450362 RepID=A0A329MRC4_9BACL|nr:DUF4832 domain-containing protein [Paenibacillus contaminans]RAV21273.1 hypothetical protein DQG23_11485 [Paenibacillus contaminans]